MTEANNAMWRQFESLLEEAVMKEHESGVELLLSYEEQGVLSTIPRFTSRTYIPLMLAVLQAGEKKNANIVKIFRKHKYNLEVREFVLCVNLCQSWC